MDLHGKEIDVMSVERANLTWFKPIETLIVEEAATLNWVQVLPLITRDIKYLYLLGDRTQINYQDMSYERGERYETNLFDLIDKKNITFGNKVRRFGDPLATKLRELIPELESQSDHSTEYQIVHYNKITDDIIK